MSAEPGGVSRPTSGDTASTVSTVYLAVQGVGALFWWLSMALSSAVRDPFVGGSAGWVAARTLVLADCIVFALGSIVVGAGLARGSSWVLPGLWILVGAAWYATLVAVLWLFDPIGEWLGVAVMVPAALITTAIALAFGRTR